MWWSWLIRTCSTRRPQSVGREGRGNSQVTPSFNFWCLVTSKGTGKSGAKMWVHCGSWWLWDYKRTFRWRWWLGGWTATWERSQTLGICIEPVRTEETNTENRTSWEGRNNVIFLKSHRIFLFLRLMLTELKRCYVLIMCVGENWV